MKCCPVPSTSPGLYTCKVKEEMHLQENTLLDLGVTYPQVEFEVNTSKEEMHLQENLRKHKYQTIPSHMVGLGKGLGKRNFRNLK